VEIASVLVHGNRTVPGAFDLPADTQSATALKDLESDLFSVTAMRDWLEARGADAP
jgi:hypothetical protein